MSRGMLTLHTQLLDRKRVGWVSYAFGWSRHRRLESCPIEEGEMGHEIETLYLGPEVGIHTVQRHTYADCKDAICYRVVGTELPISMPS